MNMYFTVALQTLNFKSLIKIAIKKELIVLDHSKRAKLISTTSN